mgnify:CR=1 FL=1
MEAEFVHYGSESLTHPESVFLEVFNNQNVLTKFQPFELEST